MPCIHNNVTPLTITVYIAGTYYFPVSSGGARLEAAGKWLLLHVSPTYNVLRHMYIVLPDDLAKGKRLVGGIVPVVTVVVVDPVVIVVAGVV